MPAVEPLVHAGRIAVPYKWSAGLVVSRFLKAAVEEKRFLASRCPACRKVSVPPLKACGKCLVENEQGVPVGPQGSLVSFTEAAPAGRPGERRVFALIKLDGADTAVLHRLEGASLDRLELGARVEPVFAERPDESPLGVRHFRLL